MAGIESSQRPSPATEADPGRALIEALHRPRYEILPLNGIAEEIVARVPREVRVTVTASASRGLEASLDLVDQLRAAGYAVVPHLSARLVRDPAHLEEVVDRLRVAGVHDVFVIAGDIDEPTGPFPGAAGLLAAIDGLGHRFAAVGISGYPESHHLISDETTIEAMFEKEPMATYIVSQICFDSAVIEAWVRRVRERGTMLPIWIGVPGIVTNRRLLRISQRIGLGESARFLRAHGPWVRRLALPRVYKPTALLADLAPLLADPAARVAGVHLYTFNELERTERWRRQTIEHLVERQNHD
jgi:methylenetetrahydrofolate reductase (NADPH)